MGMIEELRQYVAEHGLKYHIITYGCQMNEHESEKLAGILEDLGFQPEAQKEKADFVLFNTCCVRENAEKKTFGNVGALRALKEQKGNMVIAVCGCMMQQREVAEKLSNTFPFVDLVFGTYNIHALAEMTAECILEKRHLLHVQEQPEKLHEDTPMRRKSGPLASVNVMYGCDNFCSYCIVPYVRGRERSRGMEDILNEIRQLEQSGYREVMLLGQNVNSYRDGDVTFASLLSAICAKTQIPRLRFMTSHPKDLSEELIDVMAENRERLCRHIHLPVQSGSSAVLQAMNRRYTREQYLELVDRIRAKMPDIALTTDIIVGFPGETQKDFLDTLSLVERVRFESAFTFVYSRRTGTAAASMENQVAPDVQKERIMQLVALQNSITEQCNRAYEGKTMRVLVEGVSARNPGHVCGRTSSSKMVNFEGNKDMIGHFYDILITKGKRATLFGKRVGK